MRRAVFLLLALLGAATATSGMEQGNLMLAGAAMSILLVATALLRAAFLTPTTLPAFTSAVTRGRREQARRGAFRRQASPDVAGKPRPRAPGRV